MSFWIRTKSILPPTSMLLNFTCEKNTECFSDWQQSLQDGQELQWYSFLRKHTHTTPSTFPSVWNEFQKSLQASFFYYNPHSYFSRMTTRESLIFYLNYDILANVIQPTINPQQASNTKELVIIWWETAWLWERQGGLSTNSCFLLTTHN